MSSDKERDAKDQEAMRRRAEKIRDERRQRALDSAAAEEQAQINKDDGKAMDEFKQLLGLSDAMDDAEIDRRVRKWQTKHGGWFTRRKLSSKQKDAVNRAKKKKRGWFW